MYVGIFSGEEIILTNDQFRKLLKRADSVAATLQDDKYILKAELICEPYYQDNCKGCPFSRGENIGCRSFMESLNILPKHVDLSDPFVVRWEADDDNVARQELEKLRKFLLDNFQKVSEQVVIIKGGQMKKTVVIVNEGGWGSFRAERGDYDSWIDILKEVLQREAKVEVINGGLEERINKGGVDSVVFVTRGKLIHAGKIKKENPSTNVILFTGLPPDFSEKPEGVLIIDKGRLPSLEQTRQLILN